MERFDSKPPIVTNEWLVRFSSSVFSNDRINETKLMLEKSSGFEVNASYDLDAKAYFFRFNQDKPIKTNG